MGRGGGGGWMVDNLVWFFNFSSCIDCCMHPFGVIPFLTAFGNYMYVGCFKGLIRRQNSSTLLLFLSSRPSD